MVLLLMGSSFLLLVAFIILWEVGPGDSEGRLEGGGGGGRREGGRLPSAGAPSASGLSTATSGADHTLNAGGISIVFAKRLAGAVWSMRWKGHEFVQQVEGNGGSMQSACAYDVAGGETPEVENPTEAGNVTDSRGATSGRWLQAARSSTEMYTKTQMAYFYPPGRVVASSPRGTRARGPGILSNTVLTKRVTIGYRGYSNVIRYVVQFECPSPHWFGQFEILTGYMPRTFGTIYTSENGRPRPQRVSKYNPGVGSAPTPVIAAKSDAVALGVLAESWPPGGRFKNSPWYSVDCVTHSGGAVGNPSQSVPLTKWNVVWQVGSQPAGTRRIPTSCVFSVCLVVGSVSQVASILAALAR